MPSNMKCVFPEKLTQNQEVRSRRNQDQLDDISRRVEELDKNLNDSTQASQASERFTNQARHSFRTRLKSAMRLVSDQFLHPGDEKREFLSHWLAKNFAVWKEWGQLGSKATIPGAVRQQLKRAERLFTNDLPHNLGRLAIEERIRSNWQEMKKLKKKHKISDADFHDLSVLAVELSYSRWAKQYYNVGARGLEFIRGRYENFVKFMDDLGLEASEQEHILQLGRGVADSYHQALKITQEMGVNVNQLENMEFFPRQLSEDIKRRFTWERQKEGGTLRTGGDARGSIRLSDGSTIDLGQAFMKSRNTHNYVIEDEIVLQAFLEANKFFELDEIKAMGDINHVNDLLDPDNADVLNKAIFDHLADDQLETLVESGILSKIPMSAIEYRNWLSTKFPLPSENLNTIMQTDWQKAFNGYREQLKRATGRAGLVWSLVKNSVGLDGNRAPWGVSKLQVLEDAKKPLKEQQFKNWKPLFTSRTEESSILTREMEEMFIRSKLDKQGEVPQVYVHPIAAELFTSMLDIAEEPGKLGMVADQVRHFTRIFKNMAIATPSFTVTQFISPMFQTWAAGGDFTRHLSDVTKMSKVLFLTHGKKFTTNQALEQVMDNTRKVYKGLEGELVTEKELYEQGRRLGFLNDYSPGLGETAKQKFMSFSPLNLKGNFRMWAANLEQLGMGKGTARSILDAAALPQRMFIDRVAYWNMLLTTEFENAARFGTLKSLQFDRTKGTGFLDRIQQAKKVAASQGNLEFDTLEGAVEHAQNYFFMFDDQGNLDATIRDFVVPFWSYVSRNPVSQVRAAIRQPVRYGNFLRLYAATNGKEEIEEEVGMPTENFVPEWVEEQRPVYWSVDVDETPDEAKRPFVFYFPTRRIDPIGDTAENLLAGENLSVDSFLKSVGVFPEDFEREEKIVRKREDIEMLRGQGRDATGAWIDSLLENSYGTYKGIAGLVLQREIGQDKESLVPSPHARKNTTFFGVKFNPGLRYLLEETLPVVQRLNSMNPIGIFGRRGGFVISDDGSSVEVIEAKDSIFGFERTDFDRNQYMDDVAKRMEAMYGKALLGIDFLDPMYNSVRKVSDIRNNVEDLESQMYFHRKTINSSTDPDKVVQLQKELESMMITHAHMVESLRMVEDWADELGLRPMEAYRQMKAEQVNPTPLDPSERRKVFRQTVEKVLKNTERIEEELEDGSRQ